MSQVKLIAEPWDVGRMDSYDIGRFPPLWSEWNGRFRDTVRDWWRSRDGLLPDFATRLSGSADIYDRPDEGRRPSASVNFVTVHDGFTLQRPGVLRRQAQRGEHARTTATAPTTTARGTAAPKGRPTMPTCNALRARQQRAFLATLLLSAGVPLLLGGDELGRTQQGNNNAYCQDNEITWFDWSTVDGELLQFTKDVIALRRRHRAFRRRRYLTGKDAADLRWFTPTGAQMTSADWADPLARSVALFIDGATDPDVGEDGTPMEDDDFLVLVNAWWEPLAFQVPADVATRQWEIVCDSFDPARTGNAATNLEVGPRSMVVLRSPAHLPA